VSFSQDGRLWTFRNDFVEHRLLHLAIAQSEEFTADTFFRLGSSEA